MSKDDRDGQEPGKMKMLLSQDRVWLLLFGLLSAAGIAACAIPVIPLAIGILLIEVVIFIAFAWQQPS